MKYFKENMLHSLNRIISKALCLVGVHEWIRIIDNMQDDNIKWHEACYWCPKEGRKYP